MTLFLAELRKVWGARVFPLLLAVLACANLLLLWLGTRPTAAQPPAAAIRAVAAELQGMSMSEKGSFLHARRDEAEGLVKIRNYYQELAYGFADGGSYRTQNAALFAQYEKSYLNRDYTLYTGELDREYRLFSGLCSEYDTVAGYPDFLAGVQTEAGQLAGISIFQQDSTGYDLKNIERTAAVYAGLNAVEIDYYPQRGLYTALSYGYTDLLLLAAMLLLALLLVRQERDSGLLALVRSLPAGRLKTALAKLAAFAASLLAVLLLLYGVDLLYCRASFGLGPLGRSIQSVPALMRCTMQITIWEYLVRFLLAKWAGAFVMGLWVMLAALLARRAVGGWVAAVAGPLLFYAIRAAIPATSRWNVVKYANLASLLQTNELLGSYRSLYWFGSPIDLPLVEWTAAAMYAVLLAGAFCAVFARAALLPAVPHRLTLRAVHKTRPVTIARAERCKLIVSCGAGAALAAFFAFGVYQGVSAESYIAADEIYYAYYMKQLSGPLTTEGVAWYNAQAEEFRPLLEVERRVRSGQLSSDALQAYGAQQQKYNVYKNILHDNYRYLTEHEGAWFVYESGYERLFGLEGTSDVQDTLLAGLLCSLCFSGLFAMERRGGMKTVLCATPLGRGAVVTAKLRQSGVAAVCIGLGSCLPHLWQVVRDYSLPALLAPAMSLREFETLPRGISLVMLLAFWLFCRAAACLCMGRVTLWLGEKTGNALAALCLSAAGYCLPPLLCMTGMDNGIEWLGCYPLFHAAALCGTQGFNAAGEPYNRAWVAVLFLAAALMTATMVACDLREGYEGVGARSI